MRFLDGLSFNMQVIVEWITVILVAVALYFVSTCAYPPHEAYAGQLSLDVKGGVAFPIRTTPDGTYLQEAYPTNTRLVTGAWAVGLNYQLSSRPALSFQAHVLSLGSSRINGQAISDENYDHINHRCKSGTCQPHLIFQAKDSLKGGDLTATYTWQREGVRPFVKGGVAILAHHAVFRNVQDGSADRFDGIIPELELGAGLAYRFAYIELDYFQGMNFGGQNLPISTQQIVTFAGVKIPLS